MSSWVLINRRIKECKGLRDPPKRLECLRQLYEETGGDGMVAFAMGEEYESQNQLKEALGYYEEAETKFPLVKYKNMAKNAQARVRVELAEQERLKPAYPLRLKSDLAQLDPKTTLFVVACTKTKIWDEDLNAPTYVPARYAYRGKSFEEFTKWLKENMVESKGFRWLILSAKYGYIEPWHPIENYDVNFNDEKTGPISDDTLYSQVMYQKRWRDNTSLKSFQVIRCFGSKTYVEKVRQSFRDTGAQVADA